MVTSEDLDRVPLPPAPTDPAGGGMCGLLPKRAAFTASLGAVLPAILDRHARLLSLVVLLALPPATLGGCARIAGENVSPEEAESVLRVTNRGWQDATVYGVRGTSRMRFGTVSSLSSRDFAIPAESLAGGHTLVLLADPVGEPRGYRSPQITVARGDRIELWLQPVLSQSHVFVR